MEESDDYYDDDFHDDEPIQYSEEALGAEDPFLASMADALGFAMAGDEVGDEDYAEDFVPEDAFGAVGGADAVGTFDALGAPRAERPARDRPEFADGGVGFQNSVGFEIPAGFENLETLDEQQPSRGSSRRRPRPPPPEEREQYARPRQATGDSRGNSAQTGSRGVTPFARPSTGGSALAAPSTRGVSSMGSERHSELAVPSTPGGNGVLHEFVVERLQATNSQLRSQLNEFKGLLRSSLEGQLQKGKKSPRASPRSPRSPRPSPRAPIVEPFAAPLRQKQLALAQRRALAYFQQNEKLKRALLHYREGAGKPLENLKAKYAELQRDLTEAKGEIECLNNVKRFQAKELEHRARGDLPGPFEQVASLERALKAAEIARGLAEAKAAASQKRERAARDRAEQLEAEVAAVAACAAVWHGERYAARAPAPAPAAGVAEAPACAPASIKPAALRKAEAQRRKEETGALKTLTEENAKLRQHNASLASALRRAQGRARKDAEAARRSTEGRDGEVRELEATLARREMDLRAQRAAVLELKASLEALVERHKTLRGAKLPGPRRSAEVLKSLGAEPHPGVLIEDAPSLAEDAPADGTFLTNSVPYSPVRPQGLRPPDRVRTHKSPRVTK